MVEDDAGTTPAPSGMGSAGAGPSRAPGAASGGAAQLSQDQFLAYLKNCQERGAEGKQEMTVDEWMRWQQYLLGVASSSAAPAVPSESTILGYSDGYSRCRRRRACSWFQ